MMETTASLMKGVPYKNQTILTCIPAYTKVDEQILMQGRLRWKINLVVPIYTAALMSTTAKSDNITQFNLTKSKSKLN